MKKYALFVIFTMIFTYQGIFAGPPIRTTGPQIRTTGPSKRMTGFKSLSVQVVTAAQTTPETVSTSPASAISISPKPILKSSSTSSLNDCGSASPKRAMFHSGSALKSPSHFTQTVTAALREGNLDKAKSYVSAMCNDRAITRQIKDETIRAFSSTALEVMSKAAGNEDETLEIMNQIESEIAIAKTASTDSCEC